MKIISDKEKSSFFQTACEAARLSGEIIKKNFMKQKEISFKGRINLVTDVDFKSEETIINHIKTLHPDHDIITEESIQEDRGLPCRWIIDPLDGTVNYAHDYPIVAVSIGLEINGSIEIGVVFNPIMNEFFSARKGEGAFLNDNPIFVSKTDSLKKSLLATGFPYDISESSENNLSYFNHIIKHAQGVRCDGSAALNICYCAMGRFDGYWEIKIAPWDIAAGILITEEAGGVVTNLQGGPLNIFEGEIVASNGKIHKELLKEIAMVK